MEKYVLLGLIHAYTQLRAKGGQESVKQRIHPAVAVLIVLVIAGLIFGVMWWRSEAPIVGVLPKSNGLGPRPPASGLRSGGSKESPSGHAKNGAKSGRSTGEDAAKPGTADGAQ